MDSLFPNKLNKYFQSNAGKEFLIFSYKLVFDVLVLTLITFSGVLLSEAVAPGLVSSRISFTTITVLIFFVLMLINFIKGKAKIGTPKNIQTKKITSTSKAILTIVIAFLIASSLFKFVWWQIILITGIILVILYLLYQLFFEVPLEK